MLGGRLRYWAGVWWRRIRRDVRLSRRFGRPVRFSIYEMVRDDEGCAGFVRVDEDPEAKRAVVAHLASEDD